MGSESTLNPIILSINPTILTRVTMALDACGFPRVRTVKTFSEIGQMSEHVTPAVLVIDWAIGTPQRITHFLQKWRKMTGKGNVPLVIVAQDLSPTVLACGTEYDIAALFPYSQLSDTRDSFRQVFEETKKLTPIKTMLRKLSSAVESGVQEVIDERIQQLYESAPEHPRARLEFAALCVRQSNFKTAGELAEKLVLEFPKHPRALSILARTYLAEGRTSEAQTLLEQAELLSPQNVERLILLGDTLLTQGKLLLAKSNYETALDIEKKNPEATVGLAKTLLSDLETQAAVALLREVSTEAEIAAIFNASAVLASRSGELQSAISLYKHAIGVLTSDVLKEKLHFNLGLSYLKLGQLSDAKSTFEESLRLAPEFNKSKKYLEIVTSMQSKSLADQKQILDPSAFEFESLDPTQETKHKGDKG